MCVVSYIEVMFKSGETRLVLPGGNCRGMRGVDGRRPYTFRWINADKVTVTKQLVHWLDYEFRHVFMINSPLFDNASLAELQWKLQTLPSVQNCTDV